MRDVIKAALAKAMATIDARTDIPILTFVRLTYDGAHLTIAATDLDRYVRISTALDHAGALDVCVEARQFKAALDLTDDLDRAIATCAQLPVADFPLGIGEDKNESVAFSVDRAFIDLMGKMLPSVSTEETRYYLCGVYLQQLAGGSICMVATDGHRMTTGDCPAQAPLFNGSIVPRETCKWIVKNMAKATAADVTISRSHITVATSGAKIVSKLIDGTFPAYERVIPPRDMNYGSLIIGDAKGLAKRFESLRKLGSGISRAPSAKLSLNGHVTAEVTVGDLHTRQSFPIDNVDYEGEPMQIGFNLAYLKEAMALEPYEIKLGKTGLDPVRMECAGGVVHVLMPIRA